ncbi:MAG: hypothetical protein GEU88_14265 [Solirubrobacterales bacterium]|nr:hypothetical protein [Solirubrobacterales bacterium]
MPRGTIRAAALIETILAAAFEMDEILYELREHARGAQRRVAGITSSAQSSRSATGRG